MIETNSNRHAVALKETAPSTLTRITLVSPQRRVDLVLPSETPLGTLLPEIARLLGYRTSDPPHAYRVSLLDGRVLEPDQSLRNAGIADGTRIRIDRTSDAPMAAVIHDVTDEVADDLARRRGRWGEASRRWLATAVIVFAASWATVLGVPLDVRGAGAGALLVPIAGTLILLAGTAIGAAGSRAVGTAILLAGTGVVATSVPFVLGGMWRPIAWIALIGITTLGVGVCNGHTRAGVTGAGTLFALLGLWVPLPIVGLSAAQTATVMALISTIVLGLLPRVALMTSGLTKLDDLQVNDNKASRTSVDAAVDSAHRALSLSSAFTAISAAAASWLLAAESSVWALVLAGLIGLVLYLRIRAYPLTIEVVGLTVAVIAVIAGLGQRWVQAQPMLWWAATLIALVMIGLALLALSYRPPAHVRARARQIADRVEGLAIIAMVPVAVGVFGVYERLLNTF